MTLDLAETIVAVASPPGGGLRGIVRVSGPDAWDLVLRGFTPDRPMPALRRPRRVMGRLAVEGLPRGLPAALALWPGPRTYTGEPLAEIHTVGSPPLLQRVVAELLGLGGRLAQRGEFTLRAFLHGRIDLTRAEAVLGVIEADNPSQLDAALRQLAGGLAGPVEALRDRLLDVLAHLEAGLDFVEEDDVDPVSRAALGVELREGSAALRALAGQLDARDRAGERPRAVLIGPPNAGKSRLFNALLGQPRALVSDRAGTTRDYLSAPLDCDGLLVELVDTAGLEAASDPIQGQAQAQRRRQAETADLLLVCRGPDSGEFPGPDDRANALRVWTKRDLAPEPAGYIPTSAATGLGLDALRARIAAAIRDASPAGDAVRSTVARCRDGLVRAGTALDDAAAALDAEAGDELIAIDVRQAVDELGKVVGAVVTDDILDRIFSRFCIGK